MPAYDLSLTKDYAPAWTVVDAVREFFQNALDQQTTVEDNKMFFFYNELTQQLKVGNKRSVLEPKSLLLGASTKTNSKETIGQFGEGYKIATLVLLRLGKTVEFFNYGAREAWKPRFVKSRKYGADILRFDVDKKYIWSTVPDNDLTIIISGITPEEYERIKASNLHLQGSYRSFKSEQGEVLVDIQHNNKVFVNGLFVCNYDAYTFGYNFKPSFIRLDRDRKLADAFELKWLASGMWNEVAEDPSAASLLIDLIKAGASDIEYLQNRSYGRKTTCDVNETVARDFVVTHGPNAVPVTTNSEMERAKEMGRKPILTSTSHKAAIDQSGIPQVKMAPKLTTAESLQNWLDKHKQSLSKKAIKEMEEIILSEKGGLPF
ncbi:hypothetical protein D3C71_234550 [compost metagenome]